MSIHIKSAFDHISRSPFQALAAIMVLSITFFVTTILSVLVYSTQETIKYYETRPQVIAFLKEDVPEEQIIALRDKLASDARVKELNYVSKERALEIYKEATSDNPLLSELVNPSIFPASIEFSLTDLLNTESLIAELRQQEIVDEVGYTASVGGEDKLSQQLERLKTVTYYLRVGGATFALLLVSTSFLVLLIIIGMRMASRKSEIEILDLLGASAGFIRLPILIEALVYTILGVIIGWIFALILVLYSTPSLISFFDTIPVLPKSTMQLLVLFLIILAGELLAGIFLALSGSTLALSRVKRRR